MDARLTREGKWVAVSVVLAFAIWTVALRRWRPNPDGAVILITGGVYFGLVVVRVQLSYLSKLVARRNS